MLLLYSSQNTSSVVAPNQCNYRDLASRLCLMFNHKRMGFDDSGPQPIPLRSFYDNCGGLEGFAPKLNRDLRMRHQVTIPVRVSWRAEMGSDHEQTVAIGHIP